MSPILFLIFNRPSTTNLVFEAIRQAKPSKLYIAADGPREHVLSDIDNCSQARMVQSKVDWDCEVLTLFRDQNLGCRVAVSNALDWFFLQEEEGIILEDDVLPMPSFFLFCDEMLQRYRHDSSVAIISGSNLIANHVSTTDSYFFSGVPLIWGWATWRRTWYQYDANIKLWPHLRNSGFLKNRFPDNYLVQSYWRDAFDGVYKKVLNTWDYQLLLMSWISGGLTIHPKTNLTDNLGYGVGATHTSSSKPKCLLDSAPKNLDFPLRHPAVLEKLQPDIDYLIFKIVHKITWIGFVRRILRPLKRFRLPSKS